MSFSTNSQQLFSKILEAFKLLPIGLVLFSITTKRAILYKQVSYI